MRSSAGFNVELSEAFEALWKPHGGLSQPDAGGRFLTSSFADPLSLLDAAGALRERLEQAVALPHERLRQGLSLLPHLSSQRSHAAVFTCAAAAASAHFVSEARCGSSAASDVDASHPRTVRIWRSSACFTNTVTASEKNVFQRADVRSF